MIIKLYFDEDSMEHSLIRALRARGLDIVTAREVNMTEKSDEEHLIYSTKARRVLFSFNRGDFYSLHKKYILEGKYHSGIILASQQHYTVGETMRRILKLAATKSAEEMENWVEFLNVWK